MASTNLKVVGYYLFKWCPDCECMAEHFVIKGRKVVWGGADLGYYTVVGTRCLVCQAKAGDKLIEPQVIKMSVGDWNVFVSQEFTEDFVKVRPPRPAPKQPTLPYCLN